VNEMEAVFQLECNGRHTSDSHAKFKGKFLAPRQKEAVIRAVQNDPNCTGNTVIRNMRNFADERVQIDHGLKDSVERLVRSKPVISIAEVSDFVLNLSILCVFVAQ